MHLVCCRLRCAPTFRLWASPPSRSLFRLAGRSGGSWPRCWLMRPLPWRRLITIQQAIPHPTVILAAADAVVTERITRALPDDTAPAERARWADVLSARLAQVGQLEQALAAARDAVSTLP